MQAHEIVPGVYRSKGKRLRVDSVASIDSDYLEITYRWLRGRTAKVSQTRRSTAWAMEPDVILIEEDVL